jgi:hypothetical protein
VHAGGTLGFTLSATPDPSWGSGHGAAPASYSQGEAPAIGFVSEPVVSVAPGGSVTVTIGAQDVTGTGQEVAWTADVPDGLALSPALGSLAVPAGARASQSVGVQSTGTSAGTYVVQIRQQPRVGTALPPVIFEVNVS